MKANGTRFLRRGWLAGSLLAVLAFLLAGCSTDSVLDAYLQANRGQLDQPAGTSTQTVEFTVAPGTSARTIADNLQAAGLVKDARLFEAYIRANNLGSRLAAGTFTLSPNMTPVQIAEALQHAWAESVTITIPEGWRLEQVAERVAASGALNAAAYRRLASGADLQSLAPSRYDFLDALPAGASLEGFLFPDTYQVPAQGAQAADLLRRQLDNFAARVVPVYREAEANGGTQLTLFQVMTLASIVEREAVVEEERPVIARVYLNRLDAKMKLEADPTVQYAMGYQEASKQWWKTPVSLDEYDRVDSPYNTYQHDGLPPGPIASPGLSSIRAVLYPAKHDYLYFVALPDGSGRHVFAQTFAEHEVNVQKYRGQ